MPADLSGIMSQAETEQAGCITAHSLGIDLGSISTTAAQNELRMVGNSIPAEAFFKYQGYTKVEGHENILQAPVADWASLPFPRYKHTAGVVFVQDTEASEWRKISFYPPWPFPDAPKDAPPPPPAVPPGMDRDGPHKPMQPRHKPVERTIPAWPTHDPLAALYAPYEPPV